MKMISGKIIFFPCLIAFQKMLRKIFYSVMRKIEQKGRGAETYVFEKWFTKKLDINHFPNFNKGFSGQQKLFSV
jgi:hypothetical protein